VKTSKEARAIMAQLAEIEKELSGIDADAGLLEMRRQGLKAIKERMERCLPGRTVATPNLESEKNDELPAAASGPAVVKPKRSYTRKKKTMVDGEQSAIKWRCTEKDCKGSAGFEAPFITKAGNTCTTCGSLQIEEVK
jgi:hypothetical protein